MRWVDLEVFVTGEPNPYPPGVPAVRRRLRARPVAPDSARSWLLPSVNGLRAWHRVYDAHGGTVVGYAWVRRSTPRRRRLVWALWATGLVTVLAVTLAFDTSGRPDPAPALAVALVVLALVALLLAATRITAVLDLDENRVGVRGSSGASSPRSHRRQAGPMDDAYVPSCDPGGAPPGDHQPLAWPVARDFLGLTVSEARVLAAARGHTLRNWSTARFCFSDYRGDRVNIWLDEHGAVTRAEFF